MCFYLLEQQTDFLKYWTTRKALGDTATPPPPHTFLPTPHPFTFTTVQVPRLPTVLCRGLLWRTSCPYSTGFLTASN